VRRVLFLAVLAFLLCDASGLSSLIVPETCGIGATESGPDGGCPAFCVRCTCSCCATLIEFHPPVPIPIELLPPEVLALSHEGSLPTGRLADILHVPKALS
jgi:hypothetical protein